jgi:hypothetical protein
MLVITTFSDQRLFSEVALQKHAETLDLIMLFSEYSLELLMQLRSCHLLTWVMISSNNHWLLMNERGICVKHYQHR